MPDVDWKLACEAARSDANRWQRERDTLVDMMQELIALLDTDCERAARKPLVQRARRLCGL
jgi:hypothetical protein